MGRDGITLLLLRGRSTVPGQQGRRWARAGGVAAAATATAAATAAGAAVPLRLVLAPRCVSESSATTQEGGKQGLACQS